GAAARAVGARRARRGGTRSRRGGGDRRAVPHDPAHPARAVRHDRPDRRGPRDPVAGVPQHVGAVRDRGAHVYRGAAGHGRHPLAALHLDLVPDRRPARTVRAVPGDAWTTPGGYLAGDPVRSHDPLCIERAAVPPGQVAQHPGGAGYGCATILRLAKSPAELFPTHRPTRPFRRSLSWVTTRFGSFASLTNTFTCGAATTTRMWNQSFGAGAGVTGCSYFPGCSALSFCHG